MQKKGENRIREYLSKRNRYKRWISIVIVLAMLVGLTTIYSLNQDASATTQDGADEVGMILEGSDGNGADNSDHQTETIVNNSGEGSDTESVSDEQEDDGSSDDARAADNTDEQNTSDEESDEHESDESAIEASELTDLNDDESASAASAYTSSDIQNDEDDEDDEDDYVPVNIAVLVVDEDGNALGGDYLDIDIDDISFDSDSEVSIDSSLFGNVSITNEDGNTTYYEYVANSFDGEQIQSIRRQEYKADDADTDPGSDHLESDSSEGSRYNYYYSKDNTDWIKITSDAELIITYKTKGVAVDVRASVVDEFGEEIDSSFTDMDLPAFTDDVLVLDDVDNAPVAKVRKVLKTYSTYKKYSSEYTYVRATIEGNIVTSIKRTLLDENDGVYTYSYTTDGESYIDITKDTVVKLEYASDDSDTYKFTYNDDDVVVTAVLQNANAIPENAELRATRITEGEAFDAYIEALNAADKESSKDSDQPEEGSGLSEGTDESEESVKHTQDNTLLYDIAFIVSEKDDEGNETEVEYEPTEGSVKITIEFKNKQLSDIGVSSQEDVEISHMILSEEVKDTAATTLEASQSATSSDITIEEITASAVEAGSDALSNEKIEFLAESFSVYALSFNNSILYYYNYQYVDDFDYQKSFNAAYDYGVVANTYSWSGDTETNVMAGYVKTTGKDVGASVNYSNAGGNNYFGDFEDNITTVNFHTVPANIYLGSGATSKYNNGWINFTNVNGTNIVKNSGISVPTIINSIDDYYAKYEGIGGAFEASYRDWGGTTIDLRGVPNGTYVLTYTGNNIHIDDEKLNIYLNEGQHLILNCTSSDLTIGTYYLNGQVTSEYVGNSNKSYDWLTTAVIFNVVNARNVTITNTCGTFIAPDSDVVTGGVNAGVVVSNCITSCNEWHYHNHELPSVEDFGYLRIHKMVVNDFGSDFVRDKTKTALLKQVTFRITNTADSSYIVFTGFVTGQTELTYKSDGRTIAGRAVEYDKYGNLTGRSYDVTYNNSAQWTVSKLPVGTYVVDEVADGLTLGYNAVGNYYYAITDSGLSRVTKYAVTTDANEGYNYYGTGGENLRKVFSVDVSGGNQDNLSNVGQTVSVSSCYSKTQTVQVCNYYSTPVAPLEVTKNFNGGIWEDDMTFSFKLEGISATDTVLSDGTLVSGVAVPMPKADTVTGDGISAVLNDDNTYTLSINSSAKHTNKDGSYTAKASFGSISYVYEGTYTYKITEEMTGANGVIYDTSVYYATVVVSKQYTTFQKTYSTWVNYPDGREAGAFSSNDEDNVSLTKTEDFFYLGADVVYTDESGQKVAASSVRLNSGLNTANPVSNPYITTYDSSYNQNGVVFVNSYAAIKVVKSAAVEGTIANGTEFSFRVYDSEGKALKVYGYSVDAGGNVTKYEKTKDRNIVQVGGYVVITGYKSGEDANGGEIISNLVPGSSYTIVELNSNKGEKIDGAPLGYKVSYFVMTPENMTPVEGNTVAFTSGLSTVNIVNDKLAQLTVKKTWLSSSGEDDSKSHTYLDLSLYRKTQDENEWTFVQTLQLTSANEWSYTFKDLPAFDASGNAYLYRVAEDDAYNSLYSITYSYVDGNGNTTTVEGSPEYAMNINGSTYDYGQLTITNKSLVNNTLPSTGGIGTIIFRIIGGLLVLAAIVFFILKRTKKSRS